MEATRSAHIISDEAARWVARIDSRSLDNRAKTDLEEWLARDDRHRGALFRALAIWEVVGQTGSIDADVWDLLQSSSEPDEEVWQDAIAPAEEENASPEVSMGRRRLLWAGIGAAASLLPVLFLSGVQFGNSQGDARQINTQLGEMAKIPLQDGSLLVVNTASRLEVKQSTSLRSVHLNEGEAWFQVAKDATRPFVVSAGDVRVRAVGTAFSVRRRDDGADVQVTEGVVEAWSAQTGSRLKVRAGARAFVSDRAGVQRLMTDPAEIERELSWREGVLRFDGSTLKQAADEFNRYNVTKLQIDPELADETVIGRFDTAEPDTFAQVVSAAFGAKVEKGKGLIQINKQ